MSFASSCRVGWLAISGGELDCYCTPEAFKTGKPRRAFSTGCHTGSHPSAINGGIWVAVARRGRSKQASPGVHFSTGRHIGSHPSP